MPFDCGSGISTDKIIYFVIYLIVHESIGFWLPRTDKVAANSIPELIFNMFRIMWNKLRGE